MKEDSVFRCGIGLIFLWALLFALLTGGAALFGRSPESCEKDGETEPGTAEEGSEKAWRLPDWADYPDETDAPPASDAPVEEETGIIPVSGAENPEIAVYRSADGSTLKMPLEEYVLGVLSAEMPLSFGAEALKAQAVAIRTVTLYQLAVGREHGKTDASVCDDYRHCMAFFSPEEGTERFGSDYMEALRGAVKATEGLILTSDGEPVAAMFHSSSHGRTEDAEAVLGTAVPCLVSVTSWEEDRVSSVNLPFSSFRALFADRTDIPLGSVSLVRDTSGRVAVVTAFGVSMTGVEFRARAGLASADFEIAVEGETVEIVCHGSGHGIGLSQYGAARMAEWGYSFREILTHYYPGAELGNGGSGDEERGASFLDRE